VALSRLGVLDLQSGAANLLLSRIYFGPESGLAAWRLGLCHAIWEPNSGVVLKIELKIESKKLSFCIPLFINPYRVALLICPPALNIMIDVLFSVRRKPREDRRISHAKKTSFLRRRITVANPSVRENCSCASVDRLPTIAVGDNGSRHNLRQAESLASA